MDIIPQKKLKAKFYLGFKLNNKANGAEFLDEGLPFPNARVHLSGAGGIMWWWEIDGFFGTQRGKDYLNDVVARFLLTYKAYEPERVAYAPLEHLIEHKHSYKLKEISTKLNSIKKTIKLTSERADKFEDFVFWALKFYAEDLIQEYKIIPYSQFQDWGFSQFLESKEKSTIRAKCRNIWEWYEERDFKVPIRRKPWEEDMNRRKENIVRTTRIASEKKSEENRAKVLGAITQLEHLGKKITGVSIQEITGQNIKTCRKYLKEYKQQAEETI